MTKNAPPRALDEAALSEFLAEHTFGALATIKRDGRPHLSTVVYDWNPETREIRISTTEDRLKVKQLRNNPTASLYVSSADHWKFAVVEGKAELSEVTRTPGDTAGLDYLAAQRQKPEDEAEFLETIAAERRLHITLKTGKLYGTALDIA
ncbi:pyridoxamine 5'-phosphate oxidase family protein [Amycolatopsis regifaucium]|uniref:Pyridoxamine 5'-phosphate oxidase n=1 Tax=Amycolatopsis regifaucium TaxID=546365 RepID=A0A154MUJ5_9PSEU|nr:TIGR03618 family F420-dependent PPOX class oxidoreductase [Amycolatopsis regifaucium]KZB87603.1 pyridoxamine 5'-phosphate oxidase [Amycolatopsis regifaucium]OKA08432.1 pyridoxamine 5'-phosphate oxidase [Amycolatopsis regifaucium]SFI10454.1 PPOX class probable F420-dependent enzyme [Amycolatopsis regifaucium]